MRLINYLLIILFFTFSSVLSDDQQSFIQWKNNFKKIALQNNISEDTFDVVMANIKFLPNVIKYDRYQPEFYEDTKTYVTKRTSNKKVLKILEKTSIAVACSRWEEPFGRTSLEAASRWSAVIISNRGGLPETAPYAIKLDTLSSENIYNEIIYFINKMNKRHQT